MGRQKENNDRGVFQRGDIFWIRYTKNKKQYSESLGVRDKGEALDKAKIFLEDLEHQKELMSWDYEAEAFVATYKKNTKETVKAGLLAFKNFKKLTSPKKVKRTDVQDFYNYMRPEDELTKKDLDEREKPPLAESTAQRYISIVEKFLKSLHIPFNKVRFRDKPEVRIKFIKKKWIQYLMDYTQEKRFLPDGLTVGTDNQELKFVLYCIFYLGMRKEEIIMARPSWFTVDGENSSIEIQPKDLVTSYRTKTSKYRKIPLSAEFVRFLEEWEDWKENGRPFMIAPQNIGTSAGKKYRYDFRRPFDNFMKAHGFEGVSPHMGRHSFATHCIQDGIDIEILAYWLGDRVETVRRHYIHAFGTQKDIDHVFSRKNYRYRVSQVEPPNPPKPNRPARMGNT